MKYQTGRPVWIYDFPEIYQELREGYSELISKKDTEVLIAYKKGTPLHFFLSKIGEVKNEEEYPFYYRAHLSFFRKADKVQEAREKLEEMLAKDEIKDEKIKEELKQIIEYSKME
ncbi:MAG TPA: hypothetical protein PLS66_12295 [Tepiditoga sp.]|nr:hypothetical protein [Tepiditoga sp.]